MVLESDAGCDGDEGMNEFGFKNVRLSSRDLSYRIHYLGTSVPRSALRRTVLRRSAPVTTSPETETLGSFNLVSYFGV